MILFCPIPAKFFLGPRTTIDGKITTMIIGFLPGGIVTKDKIITGDIIFSEQKEYPAGKYHGWLAEDIIRDGIQIDKTDSEDTDYATT